MLRINFFFVFVNWFTLNGLSFWQEETLPQSLFLGNFSQMIIHLNGSIFTPEKIDYYFVQIAFNFHFLLIMILLLLVVINNRKLCTILNQRLHLMSSCQAAWNWFKVRYQISGQLRLLLQTMTMLKNKTAIEDYASKLLSIVVQLWGFKKKGSFRKFSWLISKYSIIFS